MIKSVILDYGLVLCHAPKAQVLEKICQLFGLDEAKFWILYERNRGLYDRGDLSSEEYWSKFAVDANKTLDKGQIQRLRRCDIEMWSDLRDDLLTWVDQLRGAGYKTAVLSNLSKEFAAHLRKNCDWIKRLDFQFFSSEIGQIKPNEGIYKYCLRVLDCSPSEALFVDDRQANVVAARKIGITSFLYRSTNKLREELEAMGCEVLPPQAGPAEKLYALR